MSEENSRRPAELRLHISHVGGFGKLRHGRELVSLIKGDDLVLEFSKRFRIFEKVVHNCS